MFDVNWSDYLRTAVLEIPTGFALGMTARGAVEVRNMARIGRLLPAFLISHRKWFRSAISGDSFPPGEAKGAPAPVP